MTRTDIHRPSAIVPADYLEVSYDYLGDVGNDPGLTFERARLRAHMQRTGGTWARNESAGTCFVCGALAMHLVIYQHVPTNTYIRTGTDCADNMSLSRDTEAHNRFRRAMTDAREAVAGKRKAQATLAERGMLSVWLYVDYVGEDRDKQTLRDMVGGLVRYGTWSEKQWTFAGTLLLRIADRPRLDAERAAKEAARADCPSGRVTIEGTVLTTKVQDSNFSRYGILKMLVEADSGYKVWGTVPDALLGGEQPLKGARVRFTATVTPKTGERSFGFFKRPTKSEVIRYAEVT